MVSDSRDPNMFGLRPAVGQTTDEYVVLVNDCGEPIGSTAKSSVHSEATPLHLAFSCYLFNENGEVLVTRRSLSKLTWPGVWTNSFCGHPGPGEDPEAAVVRRAMHELGAEVRHVRPMLPGFRYRATDASGMVENELCPVFTATASSKIVPDPDEVAEWAWVQVTALEQSVRLAPYAFSPWLVLQLNSLRREGIALTAAGGHVVTPGSAHRIPGAELPGAKVTGDGGA